MNVDRSLDKYSIDRRISAEHQPVIYTIWNNMATVDTSWVADFSVLKDAENFIQYLNKE